MPSFQTTTASGTVPVPHLTTSNFDSWRAAITSTAESLGIVDFYKQDIEPPKPTGNAQADAAIQLQHRKDKNLAFLIVAWTTRDVVCELKLYHNILINSPFDMYDTIVRAFIPGDLEACEALMAYYKLDINHFGSPSFFLREFLRLIEVLDESKYKQADVTKAAFLAHQFLIFEPEFFEPLYSAVQKNTVTYAEVRRQCTDYAE